MQTKSTIQLHIYQDSYNKKDIVKNVDKDVEKLKFLYIAGTNVKQ